MKINNKIYFKDFYVYLFVAIVVIMFFSLFILSTTCLNLKQEKQNDLRISGNQIISKIEEDFSQLNDFLFFLGKQIAVAKEVDLKNIQNIIDVLCDKTHTGPFKGITFDWISHEKKLICKHLDKVKNNFIDMSFRSYVRDSQTAPWNLHLSSPSVGISDGLWEIPGGMGITNDEGYFLGILAIGVNIAEFNSRLQHLLLNKKLSFVVLDKDFNVIFQSFDNGIDPKSSFYRQFFKDHKKPSEKEGPLSTPIAFNDIKYTYFKKMEGYPYTILLGYNKNMFYHEYITRVYIELIEVIFICAILTIIFYFLQRKKINLLNSSHFAQEFFRKQIIKSIKSSLDESVSNINIEKNLVLKEIKNEITKKNVEDFFKSINNLSQNIFLLLPQKDQLTEINVNKIINECILMKIQQASTAGVKVSTKLTAVPELKANELCFRQLVVGLILLCLESTPKGGNISISTKVQNKNGEEELEITFEDDGLPLCRDDIIRIQNKFMDNDQIWEGISSNFLFIERIVHIHSGSCEIIFPKNKGKCINIVLPYNGIKKVLSFSKNIKTENENIVYH